MIYRHTLLGRQATRKARLSLLNLESRCVPHAGLFDGHVFVGPMPSGVSIHEHDFDTVYKSDPALESKGPWATPPMAVVPVGGPGGGPAGPLSPLPFTWMTTASGLPILTSSPSSPVTIYLDFDGDGSNLPYDNNNDSANYDLAEQNTIVECWRQICVYYSMFDVNVTTVQPNVATTPTVWQLISNSISGGYAYVGAFPNSIPRGFNQSGDARTRVSGIAHEIGHNFILSHQSDYDLLGVKTAEYSSGFALHGPIMGVDFAQNVHKFIIGHPSGSASSLQDDLNLVANEIKVYQPVGGDGYRADEHANVPNATATAMPLANGYFCGWGTIERINDVDAFSFTSTGGLYGIYGNANTPSGLDVKMEVYDGAGNRLATADGANNDQNLVMNLPAGTYYVLISGSGNYADVGAYHVTARPLPAGWKSEDIGTLVTGGYAGYDSATGKWYVGGSGSDIWNTADHFRYAYTPLNGDGSITAKVTLVESTNVDAKAGVMIRQSTASGAINAFMLLKPGSANFQYRTALNGTTSNVSATGTAPYWVRLTRTGNTIVGAISPDGVAWTNVSTQTVTMTSPVLIGLAVTSHNNSHYNQMNDATFESVSLTGSTGTPAPVYNALPAPAAPTLTLGTGTDIIASWTAVPGAASYAVERSPDGAEWTQVATTSSLSYTSSGLAGGIRYFFRISARDAVPSNSPPSPVSSTVNRPGAVTNFSVTSLTTTQLVVNWRDIAGETGYRVERSADGGANWTVLSTVGANVPSYNNTGLTMATVYQYRVTPTSAFGDGPSSIYTTSTRLSPITNLVLSGITSSQTTLTWTGGVTGATGYRIQRSTDGTNFTTLTTIPGTTYNDTGLTPLGEYYYRVAAVNAYSESTSQPMVFAATAPTVVLPSPWADQDIGSVGGKGNAGINGATHTVVGTGTQIGSNSDAANFLYQPLSGDGSITARVATVENTNATTANVGIMIRENLTANARMMFIGVTPTGGSNWMYRSTTGAAATTANTTGIAAPYWFRITRAANVFTAERSTDGVAWTNVGSATLAMGSAVFAGLIVTAGDNTKLNTSTFSNVTVFQASQPPRVLQSTPSGTLNGPVNSIQFDFTQGMDQTSFNPAADIASFTGPAGNIAGAVTGFSWLTPTSLQVNIGGQVVPGPYSLTLGTQILSASGKALDQNGNGVPGEAGDGYTASFTIGRTGDNFGYAYNAIPYDPAWVLNPGDAGVVNVTSLSNIDDTNDTISLGTNKFRFYGVEYTGASQIFIASNGVITFGSGTTDYTNLDLTATPTQATIAPLWDDLVTYRNSATDDLILYKFVDLNADNTPDRLVIEWRNVHYWQQAPTSGDDGITLQAVLELNTGARSGDVVFNYTDLGEAGSGILDNGGSASVGIKDVGTQGGNRVLISQDGSGSGFVATGKAVRLFINRSPVAEAGGPYALANNGTAQLSGLASADPDQSSASLYYLWDLDGDGLFGEIGVNASRGDETGAMPTFKAQGLTGPATFNIAMKVVDEFGMLSSDSAIVNIPAPPTVTGSVIGDGTAQRSRFYTVAVSFNNVVTFPVVPETAMTLTGPSGAVPFTVALDNTSGATKATVTFGELADGKYTLNVVAANVTDAIGQALDGDNNGTAGGNYTLNFHRLFGDIDGDGTVAANDFIQFRLALGGSNFAFDYDGDGSVSASDFIQFRLRFGGSV